MKHLILAAGLLAASGVTKAETNAEYTCATSVYDGQDNSRMTATVKVPGSQEFVFSGSKVKIYGTGAGTLMIRLNKDGVDFPYSTGVGLEFPKGVVAVLATAGGVATSVRCDKKL